MTLLAGKSPRVACLGILLLATAAAPSQTLLFSEEFSTDTSANWNIYEGSGNGTPDYGVQFGFDYTNSTYLRDGVTNPIPPAPNGGGGGVKLWVNKDDTESAAAVSIYPKEKTFSGNYALKFDMWLNYNGGAGGGLGSTEFATFGINHVGDKVNWENGNFPSDGAWFAVTGESGAAGDYRSYVGDGGTSALKSGGELGGFLDRNGDGIFEDEVIGDEPDTFPFFQLFPQSLFETRGMPGKQWVEVEVRQRTNETGGHVVTWLMNNYVIAEHQNGEAVGMTAGNIMLGTMDIFASIATPKEDNYVIYDNVRVVDLTGTPPLPVVSVEATDAEAAEPANPATFTIRRTGEAEDPLTISYRLEGSATPGEDYTALPGTITLGAREASGTVTVSPLNDLVGEATETITLVLLGSTNYSLYTQVAATAALADDADVPLATVSISRSNAYEAGIPARVNVTLSNPRSSDTVVNFQVSGTATPGADYAALGTSVTIAAGETNATLLVNPINNLTTDSSARTIVITLVAGAGYELGTETAVQVAIRDDDFVQGTVLFSEDFETDATVEWNINTPAGDYPVDLFFDYSAAGIPSAPHSQGNSTHGAKLQANLTSGTFGGVSISPKDLNLTGDYALRFDMWQNFNGPFPAGGSGSTQLTGAGVGTAGTTPQWPGGTQDSVWFAATGDGGSGVDYRAYSSAAPTGYTEPSGVFAAGTGGTARNNSDPYYSDFGLDTAPQAQVDIYAAQTGATQRGALGMAWHDVVITKRGNMASWYIDGLLIATVEAEATNFVGDNILLLHSDINAGSSTDANAPFVSFGLFDNVRVILLAPPEELRIGTIEIGENGTTVQLEFTGSASDTPASFHVLSAGSAAGPYERVNATITQLGPGQFLATLPVSGERQFYKVGK